ncbi:TMEM175 family protein [Fodinicola acaciae]|uniref:TMEM175 family protein n=1 Tax=Fodinicola acaciae TaxID=2681555 RepID=UPI0013D221A6|nr:TMEM175 family protein [Fodinicola acaciae]
MTTPSFSLGRHIGFSDGVFAIAITLLVLDIRIPLPDPTHTATESQVLDLLRTHAVGPLVAYLLSFYVIGTQWLIHHQTFAGIRCADRRLSAMNLQYLALIAVMPFPSYLLANYGGAPISVAIYAAAIGIGSLLRTRMHAYAQKAGLLNPQVDAEQWRADTYSGAGFGSLFVASAAVAFWHPVATFVMWGLVLGGWAALRRYHLVDLLRRRLG